MECVKLARISLRHFVSLSRLSSSLSLSYFSSSITHVQTACPHMMANMSSPSSSYLGCRQKSTSSRPKNPSHSMESRRRSPSSRKSTSHGNRTKSPESTGLKSDETSLDSLSSEFFSDNGSKSSVSSSLSPSLSSSSSRKHSAHGEPSASHLVLQDDVSSSSIEMDPSQESYYARLHQLIAAPSEPTILDPRILRQSEAGEEVPDLFWESHKPSLNSYNRLLKNQAIKSRPELALRTLEDMQIKHQISPDLFSFTSAVQACADSGDVTRADTVMNMMNRCDLQPSLWTHSALVRTYINGGQLEKAVAYVRQLENQRLLPDQVIYSNLLQGFVDHRLPERAWELWDHMRTHRFLPDEVSYSIMISLCHKMDMPEKGVSFLDEMRQLNLRPTDVSYGAAIAACAERRTFELFHQMQAEGFTPSIHVYNSLLHACSRTGDVELALKTLRIMVQSQHITPQESTYNALLSVYASAQHKPLQETNHEENIAQALRVYGTMKSSGFPITNITLNALLSVFCHAGRLLRAEEVFTNVFSAHNVVHDELSHALMARMYAKHKRVDSALKHMDEMNRLQNSRFLAAGSSPLSSQSMLAASSPLLPKSASPRKLQTSVSSGRNSFAHIYDEILKGCASVSDISGCVRILQIMHHQGISPNVDLVQRVLTSATPEDKEKIRKVFLKSA